LNAAKRTILLLWLVIVASLGNASALTPGALETRVWQKSSAPLETRQADPTQPLEQRQANASCAYELAPESLLAAESGQNLLTFSPTVELGNAKYGLEHILRRHSFNTGAENVSRFSQGMGHIEIKGLINEAAQSGTAWQVQGGSRVLNANMGRVIGTDQAGNAVSGLRVVTDSSGRVITTYPIAAP